MGEGRCLGSDKDITAQLDFSRLLIYLQLDLCIETTVTTNILTKGTDGETKHGDAYNQASFDRNVRLHVGRNIRAT